MGKMILLADSGATKTDWCLVENAQVVYSVQTKGLNPYFLSYQELVDEIRNEVLPKLHAFLGAVDAIYFYGAGCVFDQAEMMRDVLASLIKAPDVRVYSDLLAAAHSTCGSEAGIACILGTGSNSCFYDGKEIVKNIPPLGFILGDEGSGAALGRLLVADVLKEILSLPLRHAFFERFGLTREAILEHVYRRPFPSRFLAGLSPFLSEHIHIPEIRLLVKNSFNTFLTRNVMQYDYKKYPTHFVGSIAFHYQDILREAAAETGIIIGKIEKNPVLRIAEQIDNAQWGAVSGR